MLNGVAATSGCKAWAVGSYEKGFGRSASTQTLVLYWNGKRWKVERSQNPGRMPRRDELSGVSATSPTNAWAVGSYAAGCAGSKGCVRGGTLVEHWDGEAWKVQSSPTPARFAELSGVAATSRTNAWAVGFSHGGTLVEHWDGKAWKVQPSPTPARFRNGLSGVSATSPTNAWTVGTYSVVEHWDGKAWKIQPIIMKRPGRSPELSGVAATSPTNAWTVGARSRLGSGGNVGRTLIEHWNGTAWKIQKSPNLKDLRDGFPEELLLGVAATSSTNAWAVGRYDRYRRDRTLALHWNGTTWGP